MSNITNARFQSLELDGNAVLDRIEQWRVAKYPDDPLQTFINAEEFVSRWQSSRESLLVAASDAFDTAVGRPQ